MEVRWHVFQLAFADPALDQQGQAFEVRGTDLVQLLDHLRHLVALDHFLFEAVEQAIALWIAHAEFEVGPGQGFLVLVDIGRMQQSVQIALVVEHQAQIDFRLGFEVLVDRAFADTDGISNHLDGDTVFTLFEEQL
ncbi:hypothetical protein D9M71_514690 [compost metagenome]